jgi:hypothetical protein
MVCYTVARYACDPKGFPKTPQGYWSLPWDEEGSKLDSRSIIESHARKEARRKLLEEANKVKS